MAQRYVIDTNKIIYEEIEAELVVINLKTGSYYSLNEPASLIWKLIVCGNSLDQIAQLLKSHFAAEDSGIPDAIARIASEFLHEELISAVAEPVTAKELSLPNNFVMPGSFRNPVISKHSDIQDMLQLDPIHEVTDLGWPHQKNKGAS